jgi:hypothetical protein
MLFRYSGHAPILQLICLCFSTVSPSQRTGNSNSFRSLQI